MATVMAPLLGSKRSDGDGESSPRPLCINPAASRRGMEKVSSCEGPTCSCGGWQVAVRWMTRRWSLTSWHEIEISRARLRTRSRVARAGVESDEDECEGSRGAEVRKWTKTRCDECAGTSSVEKALSTW